MRVVRPKKRFFIFGLFFDAFLCYNNEVATRQFYGRQRSFNKKMKKTWNVNVNGMNHAIEYKTGFGGIKISVNGTANKVKSQNWFIMMLDYPIQIDGTEIRVVALGSKVRLAVNGIYQDNGQPYQPLNRIPTYCHVLLGISCVAGFLLCGWIGLAIGVLFGTLYIKQGLSGKTGVVIGSFIGCSVIQIAIMIAVLLLQY